MTARAGVLLLALLPACSWLERRARDGADCFRIAAGVGIGLGVEAHATDWVSPGLGIVTYTQNVGWLDRGVHGIWLESDVITTPRLAYESIGAELESQASKRSERSSNLLRLAISGLNLPNERWIRCHGVTSVEYYALINAAELGKAGHATWLTDLLVEPGAPIFVTRRSVWQRGCFEIGATVLIAHGRLGFNPFEFVDFLGGLVGLDLAGDDRLVPFYRLEPLRDERRERVDRLFDPTLDDPSPDERPRQRPERSGDTR